MKEANLLLALAFTWMASSVGADTISGRVVNVHGEPLLGVSVVTNVTAVGTMTDKAGEFTLQLTDEVKRVTFSAVGFKPRLFRVSEIPPTVTLDMMYYEIGNIVVTAERARPGITPIAFDNFSQDDIERDYTVGEFPLLLESTPNLYVYTDGSTPLGYSYVKIRGFDDKRIATYINGVPLNDPEDHATYFVDLPDFAANITDIQVQRGVGNSLYGDASFGGAINIVTSSLNRHRKVTLSTGYGEYTSGGKSVSDIYKQSLEYSSGLIDSRWLFGGRFSKQKTGGYRENSWYRGWSYYFSVARLDPRMVTELHIYGGPMRMHLAYYGVDRETLRVNRRTNPGIEGYEPLTYGNATDNFNQPHYQLHNRYKINDRMTLSNTLYYIRGKGYYEQFKPCQDYADYSIDISLTGGQASGDLVRQKWVYKNQYGWDPRLDIQHERGSHSVGGSFYLFDSDHWGEVVWAQHIEDTLSPRHQYYNHYAKKRVASLYGQEYFKLTEQLSAQITAQVRYERYSFNQNRIGPFPGYIFDVDWLFFSPRVGLNYKLNEQVSLYTNAAVASRAPNDDDIYDANKPGEFPSLERIDSIGTYPGGVIYTASGDPTADPERLYDFELGGSYRAGRYSLGANLFYMDFQNEILEYAGSSEGRDVTINVDGSYRSGIELSGVVELADELIINGNFSYNYNNIKDYFLTYSLDSVVVDTLGIPIDTITLKESVNCRDKKLPNFPKYLGNVVMDYNGDWLRLTWYGRFIGRQYADLWNIKEFSIDPVFVSSASASVRWKDFLRLGCLTLTLRVDNLFDKKYETTASYAENWASREQGELVRVDGWVAYFVAAERSFYGQVKLEMF